MHYYPFHLKDYRAATAHLTNDQDLAYRRLLDMYYDLEAPLPADVDWVAKRVRLPEDVVAVVLADMFTLAEDGWHNQRADEELAKMRQRVERNRENGRRGGRKPSGNPVGTQSQPSGNRVGSQWQPTLGIGYMGTGSSEGEPEREGKDAPVTPRNGRVGVTKPDEVTEQAWGDWLTVRKAKRAGPVTKTVLDAMQREANKAGLDLQAAVAEAAARSWQAFKAEWVTTGRDGKPKPKTYADRCVKLGDPEEDWPV